MEQLIITKPEIKLVGIKVQTCNEWEMNPGTAKIGATVSSYFSQDIGAQIPHRKIPRQIYCAYTDYENAHHGKYTFFMGEEVETIDSLPPELCSLIIPPQTYTRFTTPQGPMPSVCIEGWQKIWTLPQEVLNRSYRTDFELYDHRAQDPQNTILDIYIGIQG